MQKDIQQINHLARWAIIVSFTACAVITLLIILINSLLARHPEISTTWYFRACLFVIAVFLTFLICRQVIIALARYLNKSYFKQFTEIKALGTFKESETRTHNVSDKKHPHAVLLLHGFTASPEQFEGLLPSLERMQLPYMVPAIIGFGLNSPQLLEKIRYEDWFRFALEQYDALQMCAENISIIGHSMGGMLAAFIAQHRKVKHLVLSAPAIYSVPRDLAYKKLFFSPWLGRFFAWLVPYIPKSMRPDRKSVCDVLDYEGAGATFQYFSVPANCIKEIFKMQEKVNLKNMSCETLAVLYGKHDQTVNNSQVLEALKDYEMKFRSDCLDNSGHNILDDFDKHKAIKIILATLDQA